MNASPSEHPSMTTLHAYRTGMLDTVSAELIHRHIEDCHECERQVAEMGLGPFLGEMEKPGLGDKVECTLDQMASICRLRANPERERQGGIVPPPFGLGPWVGARVVSPRSPILRPGRRSS